MANAIAIVAPGHQTHLAVVAGSPSPGAAYRDAMRQLAGGVGIVTAGTAPHRTGFTATSVASLSADPPRLIVGVDRATSSFSELERCRCFAVSILAAHQSALAARFAGSAKGDARFAGACWHPMITGAPLLCDALVAMDCELEELIERHSHAIAIGRVVATRGQAIGDALIRWRGDYHALAPIGDEGAVNQWQPIIGSRNVGCG